MLFRSLAVVIIAMILDRITGAFAATDRPRSSRRRSAAPADEQPAEAAAPA